MVEPEGGEGIQLFAFSYKKPVANSSQLNGGNRNKRKESASEE
jgi:hypothetical protein